MIHDVSTPFQTEGPAIGVDVAKVHDVGQVALEEFPSSFGRVLVLKICFALPIVDDKVPEDVLNTTRGFTLSIIGDQLVHSSSVTYDVFESVDELSLTLHSIDIDNAGLAPDV